MHTHRGARFASGAPASIAHAGKPALTGCAWAYVGGERPAEWDDGPAPANGASTAPTARGRRGSAGLSRPRVDLLWPTEAVVPADQAAEREAVEAQLARECLRSPERVLLHRVQHHLAGVSLGLCEDEPIVTSETSPEAESIERLRRCFERVGAIRFRAADGEKAWLAFNGEIRNGEGAELRREATRALVEAARLTPAEREVLWAGLALNDDHHALLEHFRTEKLLDEDNGL